jgi:hypothetical protein
MEQVARNITDAESGFLSEKSYLIVDRDALFSPCFKGMLEESGVSIVLTAYQAPNMNAYAERFVRSIKVECWSSARRRTNGRRRDLRTRASPA